MTNRSNRNLRRSARRMLIERLQGRELLAADFQLTKDINSQVEPILHGVTNFGTNTIAVGTTVFFTKNSQVFGRELWKTDGTEAGTSMVKDIVPGAGGTLISSALNVNGTLYFVANEGLGGAELWKSDGTAAGTTIVKDILPGPNGSSPQYLANVNGTLYFNADDGVNGREAWKSDGTAAGTTLLKDINVGSASSSPRNFVANGATVYFSATDSTSGEELWKSDGTAVGTALLKDVNTGASSGNPRQLNVVGGVLYFAAFEAASGTEIWKSDGTTLGTTLLKDVRAGTSSSGIANLTPVGGTLYFYANDGTNGYELWKSTGTTATTTIVKDINTNAGASGVSSSITSLAKPINMSGTLYFTANDGTTGTELWKSDGSAAGTVLVRNITTVAALSSDPYTLTNANGTLYFYANDGSSGIELWKSDGSVAGTIRVADVVPGSGGIAPSNTLIANTGSTVYFGVNDGTHGMNLWKSDGTTQGTVALTQNLRTSNGYVLTPINFNGQLVFSAWSGSEEQTLWTSDGTASGTKPLVVTNNNAPLFNSLIYPISANGSIVFAQYDSTHGRELWTSDGTVAGTKLVIDIFPGTLSSTPTSLVNVNGMIYFGANDGVTGRELWKSDGTIAGTMRVKDISIGTGYGSPYFLTNLGGTLLFTANDGTNGSELWKSDGTAAGTVMVKDIRAGSSSPGINGIFVLGGMAYFAADDGINGRELWRTDGTAAGTFLVRDINPGVGASNPTSFASIGSTLYLSANDGTTGDELWKSDGTSVGTVQVKDIQAGSGSGLSAPQLTVVGTTLFLAGNDGTTGRELWKSDGTTAGTVLVKDVAAGFATSNPASLTNINGLLYYQANDGISGEELWTSDGTAAGTNLRYDFVPGPAGSQPGAMTLVGDSLYVVATSDAYGRELYAVEHQVAASLTGGSGPRSATVARSGNVVSIVDNANATVLDSSEQLFARSVSVTGSAVENDTVTIDYSSGFYPLRNGLQLDGGNGAVDNLNVIGTTGVSARYASSGNSLGNANVLLQKGTESSNLAFTNFETLTLTGLNAVTLEGEVLIGNQSLSLGSQLPLNMGALTQISGGSLSSTATIALGSGESLTGFGTVAGRLAAEAGSYVGVEGALTIGLATSPAGFLTRGQINVGVNTLTLLDANQAVLGSETTLGLGGVAGTIDAANGLLIDFGNNLTGFGTLETPNLVSKLLINNGAIVGNSVAQPIRLNGYVKGVGTLDNVNIVGTYSPGFSPAAVTLGSMQYAAGSNTVIELGGLVAGDDYDQLNHTGTAQLGGTLDVQLINGFHPAIGNSFTVITAAGGITGSFSPVNLPALPAGSGWQVQAGTNSFVLTVIAVNQSPIDIALSASSVTENSAVGTAIGNLSSVDPDVGNTFTYTLVSGSGSDDNGSFAISGTALQSNGSFNFETKPSYSIRVRTTDSGGAFFEKSFTISVLDLPELIAPPRLGDGTAQRSLVDKVVLTFDGSISIDSGAFALIKRGAGTVTTAFTSTVNGSGQTVVTLTFSGALTRGVAGALSDGYYQLTIDGTKIQRASRPLDVNADGIGGDALVIGAVEADNFFALFGDTNGDGVVGVTEFGQFRTTFGKLSPDPSYNAIMDYESDGSVGISDFGQFRSRFGKPKLVF